MAKPSKKPKPEDVETEPGAEERFERTVRRMLNTPPRPHKANRLGKTKQANRAK